MPIEGMNHSVTQSKISLQSFRIQEEKLDGNTQLKRGFISVFSLYWEMTLFQLRIFCTNNLIVKWLLYNKGLTHVSDFLSFVSFLNRCIISYLTLERIIRKRKG